MRITNLLQLFLPQEENLHGKNIFLSTVSVITSGLSVEPNHLAYSAIVSEKIAPEMVVVDDEHNGWRSVVLPQAHSDEIVMNAVLAASAYHMTGSLGYDAVSDELVDPSKLFVRAIEGLQKRRQLTEENVETQQTIILSIIVLIVSFMVNGCTDFPIIFQMLTSALDAIGGEAALEALGGEVAGFCLREIRK